MFGRKLACSFCGKGEADVAKLVAGPRVYICDQCAAEAIRIMDSGGNEPGRSPSSRGPFRRVYERMCRPWRGCERSQWIPFSLRAEPATSADR